MDSSDCTTTGYLIATYDARNYTVNCAGSNCEGIYGTYSGSSDDCDTTSALFDNYESQYSELAINYETCAKVYNDPDDDSTWWSVYENLYRTTSCLVSCEVPSFVHLCFFLFFNREENILALIIIWTKNATVGRKMCLTLTFTTVPAKVPKQTATQQL